MRILWQLMQKNVLEQLHLRSKAKKLVEKLEPHFLKKVKKLFKKLSASKCQKVKKHEPQKKIEFLIKKTECTGDL